MNPFPLIEVAVQLPERGKRIRQAFAVGFRRPILS